MNKLNYIWNFKISGFPFMLKVLLVVFFNKTLDFLTTIFGRANLGSHGINITIRRGFLCRYPRNIKLGSYINIGKMNCFTTETESSFLELKNKVSIGDNCKIDYSGGVLIERNVHIAHNVIIISHTHGYNYRSNPIGIPLIIGRNAFIGDNCIILYNVKHIGKNAIIGAGAVVTKDVPDNSIVAGNPARVIKYIC